jgi:pyruvate,water dikinase
MSEQKANYIRFFDEIGKDDVPRVGGKNASLGEMTRNLKSLGVKVPYGFAITGDAYNLILETNSVLVQDEKVILKDYIVRELNSIDHELRSETPEDILVVKKTTIKIRKSIEKAQYPPELRQEIIQAYRSLEKITKGSVYAVRSSATAEDLPDASFAGQQDTYLNIYGEEDILDHILKCMASTFTTRATQYRQRAGFNHFNVRLSVGVQEMAGGLSGVYASGVMFSIDPDSGNDNFIVIRGTYGLGEMIVQGKEVGDEWKVFKHSPLGIQITSRTRVLKNAQYVTIEAAEEAGYEVDKHVGTVEIPVPKELRNTICLTDDKVEQLAKYAIYISDHYKRPMDIEWVLGKDQNIYVVQARPETVESRKGDREEIFYLLEDFEKLKQTNRILDESGVAIGRKIGCGPIKIINDISEAWKLKKGDVLVTLETNPDWTSYLNHLSGIITEKGGPTCHAAIVSREQGIACIVGADGVNAKIEQYLKSRDTEVFYDENRQPTLTIECCQGIGRIWKGQVAFDFDEIDFRNLPKTKTKIQVNVGIPDGALSAGKYPDGTGLARLEFIISDEIMVHPKALINYMQLQHNLDSMKAQRSKIEKNKGSKLSPKDKLYVDIQALEDTINRIDTAVEGYGLSTIDFYVQKLAEGIATIAGAVWKTLDDGTIAEAVVRMSDFKTNEYQNLIGGWMYEGSENNPMIGHRGASRYVGEEFVDCFRLECRAISRARSWGLSNIVPMIPFVRTPTEAIKVQKIMAEEGLVREEFVQGVMAKYNFSREKVLREVKEEGLVRAAAFDYIETCEGIEYELNPKGLKIYMMAEIPSNIVLADIFSRLFDGFSIGSNDLTQLVFGVDRDSERLAKVANKFGYDANSEAIKRLIAQLLKAAHYYETSQMLRLRRKVGICGQAPSDFPDFLQFLVQRKIDSISLNFDTYAKGRVNCYRTELIEEKLNKENRKKAYEILNSYDSIINELRMPRGRMRYLKQMLLQSNRKEDNLWDMVEKFNKLSETLNTNRDSFLKACTDGSGFTEACQQHEKILSDRTLVDALIAYSSQRWSSFHGRNE